MRPVSFFTGQSGAGSGAPAVRLRFRKRTPCVRYRFSSRRKAPSRVLSHPGDRDGGARWRAGTSARGVVGGCCTPDSDGFPYGLTGLPRGVDGASEHLSFISEHSIKNRRPVARRAWRANPSESGLHKTDRPLKAAAVSFGARQPPARLVPKATDSSNARTSSAPPRESGSGARSVRPTGRHTGFDSS